MEYEYIKEEIINCIASIGFFDKEEITLDMDLQEEAGIDSVSVVELSVKIEEIFEIDTMGEMDNLIKLKTVSDLIEWVEKKKKS